AASGNNPSACPVDHSSESWKEFAGSLPADHPPIPSASTAPRGLSQERETSSIPRADADEKWVYPSQAQFYAAMERKNHNPQARDMPVLVPIHNAVNERAWTELMKWEQGMGGEKCGGVKLVSFKGRPKDRTIRAWFNVLLGYQAPFDRHDWVIDRCGVKQRYIIDFYSGKMGADTQKTNISFYLDVRPAFDTWEGFSFRASKFFGSLFG
ncbi:cytochrome C1 heme lyase, partial [Clavulina sp. PMI_390]